MLELTRHRAFYVTNDHYFFKGPLRYLEEKLGPWSWATDVQYCDATQEVRGEKRTQGFGQTAELDRQDIQCRQVTGPFPGANGIAAWENKVFVGDSKNATVSIYRLQPDMGLEFESQVVSVSETNTLVSFK